MDNRSRAEEEVKANLESAFVMVYESLKKDIHRLVLAEPAGSPLGREARACLLRAVSEYAPDPWHNRAVLTAILVPGESEDPVVRDIRHEVRMRAYQYAQDTAQAIVTAAYQNTLQAREGRVA